MILTVSFILQGLSNELAKMYSGPEWMVDLVVLWTNIKSDSKSKLKLDFHHPRMQLTEIRIEECSSVDAYVDRFQQVGDQIALAGKTIADGEPYFQMLQGVPAQWANYKDMMGMHIGIMDKWEELNPLMLKKEGKLRKTKGILPHSALYTWSGTKGVIGGEEKREGWYILFLLSFLSFFPL